MSASAVDVATAVRSITLNRSSWAVGSPHHRDLRTPEIPRRMSLGSDPIAPLLSRGRPTRSDSLLQQFDSGIDHLPMKRITIPVALAFSFLVSPIQSNAAEDAIASEVLLQASQSWKGDIYQYPEGTPLITVKMVVFKPGAKSKPHSHDMPGAALIQEGELLCEVPATGLKKRFIEGDVLPTTFKNDLHTCENTGKNTAKALVFYAGAVDLPTSYYIQK